MDSLADWYRYVDRLSRPPSRLNDDAAEERETSEWRPWRETADVAPVLEAVRPEEIPNLAPALGLTGPSEARLPAGRIFEDLTVHDRLHPIPEFNVPEFQVPTFEVKIPSWQEQVVRPARTERTEAAVDGDAELDEAGEAGEVSDEELEAADGELPESLRGSRYWELLARIRGEEPGEPGQRLRARESRQELLQRLVDPTLTLEETALILEVCPTTVRRYTNKGLLRHFRTKGNQRRFRFSDVLEFMESRAAEIEADSRADREAGRG